MEILKGLIAVNDLLVEQYVTVLLILKESVPL